MYWSHHPDFVKKNIEPEKSMKNKRLKRRGKERERT
jgi:hypothetical protein